MVVLPRMNGGHTIPICFISFSILTSCCSFDSSLISLLSCSFILLAYWHILLCKYIHIYLCMLTKRRELFSRSHLRRSIALFDLGKSCVFYIEVFEGADRLCVLFAAFIKSSYAFWSCVRAQKLKSTSWNSLIS